MEITIDNKPRKVFDESVVAFLDELSSMLMKSPVTRQYPDLMSFAFYIRKANLLKIKNTTLQLQLSTSTHLGRGLCFHIAPSNIPINFAFSWVFSLLAGNANIVRLPSKEFPQVTALIGVVDKLLAQPANSGLRTSNLFVRYPRTDNETTARYSAMADCRMIWGGDRTIAEIRTLPTKPRCVDIAFADRYSVAIIDGEAVLSADDEKIARLANDFYNDTYLVDQNACSSPQLILWEHDSPSARERFWSAVRDFAATRYQLQDAVAVDKYTALCEDAVGNSKLAGVSREGNLLYRLELSALEPAQIERRGKGGYFYEYALDARRDFFDIVTEKVQTVTYFGINARSLAEDIAASRLRGIDRIVPIGKALDIGAIWDGHDLICELSRESMI